MKNRWLNLVLSLTNKIYVRKQMLLKQIGLRAVIDVLILIFLEVFLAIISLPLYLTLRTETTTAYLENKRTYGKIPADYNLRRILTLTGLGTILLIFAIKLVIILAVPPIYGPLQLYKVSNLQPMDIASRETILNEISIHTSKVSKSIPRPVLVSVDQPSSGVLVFHGTAQPLNDVVLLLSDQHASILYGQTDSKGNWQIDNSQQTIKLANGNHSILVYSYDKTAGLRSETSDENFVKITSSWKDVLLRDIDVFLNWFIVIMILVGAFLILLTV